MKQLLIGTAAIALGLGVVTVSAPAKADGLKLDLAGHFKGYMSWLDQDTTPDRNIAANDDDESEEERELDILRETEIHFTGETALDNGLTVGVHVESDIDGTTGDNFNTEEAYAYFSGAWGRVNFGREDGAAYLLQVAAPSADSNVDGLRQYIQAVNYNIVSEDRGAAFDVQLDTLFNDALATNDLIVDSDDTDTRTADDILAGANIVNLGVTTTSLFSFDYENAVSGTDNKVTYLTPVFNGFQLGASYTPDLGGTSRDDAVGNNADDQLGDYGDVWEIAARFEGQLNELGIVVGGGYAHASVESEESEADTNAIVDPVFYQDENGNAAFNFGVDTVIATLDDREAWNAGIDLNWGPFGLGVVYTEDDHGVSGDALQKETWSVGLDYTTGPFKIGGSYLDSDQTVAIAELETNRWTGGVVYTYGPGMTFRGSINYIEHEGLGADVTDIEATSVLLGTQIDF